MINRQRSRASRPQQPDYESRQRKRVAGVVQQRRRTCRRLSRRCGRVAVALPRAAAVLGGCARLGSAAVRALHHKLRASVGAGISLGAVRVAGAGLAALAAAAPRVARGRLGLRRRGAGRQAAQRGPAQAPARVGRVVRQAERPAG